MEPYLPVFTGDATVKLILFMRSDLIFIWIINKYFIRDKLLLKIGKIVMNKTNLDESLFKC